MNSNKIVYCDASFSRQLGKTVGGYAIAAKDDIHYRVFECSSSTAAEIETILWTLSELGTVGLKLFTDCQTVINLPARRSRLEHTGFISKSSGQPLKLASLYRRFYQLYDQYQPELTKIKGHLAKNKMTKDNEAFAKLDRRLRQVLRSLD